jgi:hypothetical protein
MSVGRLVSPIIERDADHIVRARALGYRTPATPSREIEMDGREHRTREEGVKFGVVMICIAVLLAGGAIWFALTR